MKFLIEKWVVFDSASCRLIHAQTADDVAISVTHAQLLSLLIEYQGFAVSRNEIFEKIFDVNGAHATNNNLNQNVSVLRKQIAALGIDNEVITTVPRVGFMISDSVLIEPLQDENVTSESEPPLDSVNKKNVIKNYTARLGTVLLFLPVVLALTQFLFFYHVSETSIDPKQIPLLHTTKINNFQGCDVRKLSVRGAGDDYLDDSGYFMQVVNGLKCENPAQTTFYLSKNTVSNSNYRAFTLKCIKTDAGQYDCYSVYYNVEEE